MKKIETTLGTLSVQDFENTFNKAVLVSYNRVFILFPLYKLYMYNFIILILYQNSKYHHLLNS